MNNITIFAIQQQLQESAFISIPRIQKEYGLTYAQGRRFLQNLLDRGWIEEKAVGIRYQIRKDMLKLRKIRKDEVEDLTEAINTDAANALMAIVKGNGIDFDAIEDCVSGREDTRKALELLVNKDLIFCWRKRYYSCVSGRTAKVLKEVASEKDCMTARSRLLKKEVDFTTLLEKFRVLFEEA